MAKTSEITGVQYTVLSPEEIRGMSVCEITSTALKSASNKRSLKNSLFDLRMGPSSDDERCATCKGNRVDCPGHFGHIELPILVINPAMSTHVINMLQCVCYDETCALPIIAPENYDMQTLSPNPLKKIAEMATLAKTIRNKCINQHYQPLYVLDDYKVIKKLRNPEKTTKVKDVEMTAAQVYRILASIDDETIDLWGINSKQFHPRNMVLQALPVVPPAVRPHVVTGTTIALDDLVYIYNDILKICLRVRNHFESIETNEFRDLAEKLNFCIRCLFDNRKGDFRHSSGQKRSLKSLRDRLDGKQGNSKFGRMRQNIQGKRGNFSARTVITAGADLRLDEIGVPEQIARTVTKPVTVNNYNVDQVKQWLTQGKVNRIVSSSGQYIKMGKNARIEPGDVVERHLQDGDTVVINRQPSLHRGSMIAAKARIQKVTQSKLGKRDQPKTFTLPLAMVSPLNADFDGDEVNMYVPQSLGADAELSSIPHVSEQIVSAQNGKPVIGLNQDALTSAFLLTRGFYGIEQSVAMDSAFSADVAQVYASKIKTAHDVYSRIPRELLANGDSVASRLTATNPEDLPEIHGDRLRSRQILNNKEMPNKLLMSMVFPETLQYNNHGVIIEDGILISGTLSKATVGTTKNAIHHILWKNYSSKVAMEFLSAAQQLLYRWMLSRGFSIGLQDCMLKNADYVQEEVSKIEVEADFVAESEKDPEAREFKINGILNRATAAGQRLATESMDPDNAFNVMATAGSKGSVLNICMVSGFLGQQNVEGKRVGKEWRKVPESASKIPKYVPGSGRTLPHFAFDDDTPQARGFVRSSFLQGLKPHEMFMHAQGGRTGLTDTAVKTAETGYIQRRMINQLSDLRVEEDLSVRDANGRVFAFHYGDDGLDAARRLKGKMVDAQGIANSL